MSEPAAPVVYQLRVVLRGISPLIWRRLLVRGDSTIAALHHTLQIAVGWSDGHLHRFIIHGKDYGIARLGGPAFADDPARLRLADFAFRPRERFVYQYDFGADWQHDLRVEQIGLPDPRRCAGVAMAGGTVPRAQACTGYFGHPRGSRRCRVVRAG